MPRYLDRVDDLIPLAEGRDGYFTAAEAGRLGITTDILAHLARAGHIEREAPAVYRLARWPAAVYPGLWAAFLWAESKGAAVFSHRTALALHRISDVNPAKIDLTFVDRMPRIRGNVPPAITLRARKLGAQDVTMIDGLPVTRLRRTLADLIIDNIALDAVEDVLTHRRDQLSDDDFRAISALRDLPRDLRNYIVHASRDNK